MEAGDRWLSDLGVGLRRGHWGQKYGEREEWVFQQCKEVLFPDREGQRFEDWWIFVLSHLSEWPFTHSFAHPDCQFKFAAPEAQQEIIETIADQMGRFKRILPELELLVQDAE